MITKVGNGRPGQVIFEFSSGAVLSVLWALGSYSDNHDLWKYKDADGHPNWKKQDFESTTVEIYSMGAVEAGMEKYLERVYGQNPAAYVPVDDIPKILRRANREPVRRREA